MYLFGAREPEKPLRDLSESVMREVIGDRTVDEVLTSVATNRDINVATSGRSLFAVRPGNSDSTGAAYERSPPPAVQAAFNDVNQANRKSKQRLTRPGPFYNDAVPNARGQAKEREKQRKHTRFAG